MNFEIEKRRELRERMRFAKARFTTEAVAAIAGKTGGEERMRRALAEVNACRSALAALDENVAQK